MFDLILIIDEFGLQFNLKLTEIQMKFRYARHTNDLHSITEFYTKVVGLEKLGSFENHSCYNGVFLGYPNMDWHLEFTTSNEKPKHSPGDDDLLVFYLNSNDEKGASIIISKTIAMVDECANTFEHVLEVENNIEEASNLLVRLQYLCKIEKEETC